MVFVYPLPGATIQVPAELRSSSGEEDEATGVV